MKTHELEYSYSDWKEEVVAERPDGSKVTTVTAAAAYAGALEGPTHVAFVMHYRPDGTGSYDGWEELTGSFEGSAASMILRHVGTFDAEAVSVEVSSVVGSGIGAVESRSLRFAAGFLGHGPYPVQLEVE